MEIKTMTEKTTSTKAVNYPPELTAHIVEVYCAADSEAEREQALQDLSHETGKTIKSLRQKLVREKVYIKKVYKTKTGKETERKEKIVADIANTLGVPSENVESLVKATKPVLELLRGTLIAAAAAIGGDHADD
jgi:response regulator RpfG family c-di-GMP phosphodiesterase